jgi:NAD(P)-dependent dehydrogenase (short-subunit alcohol dehydrogenase family)
MSDTRQIALVTGAAGNLGRAVAEALASRGFRVAALDRLAEPLEGVVAALPDPASHLVLPGVDLMDPAACDAALARLTERFGRLDAVAHTVGGFAMAALSEPQP